MLNLELPASEGLANLSLRTTARTAQIFTDLLAAFPDESSEVQGFTAYSVEYYECRNPLQVHNLLGPRFHRTFDPSLKEAISAAKNASRIDKSRLHRALLEKYLGIRLTAESVGPFNPQGDPNAYQSMPAQDSSDYTLHLNFLQPFRLFGITDQNRKKIWGNPAVRNRAWFWHQQSVNTDTAPLFRKIIQAYILAEVLADYAAPNDFQDPIVRAKLSELQAAHQAMLEEISLGWRALFTELHNLQISLNARQIRGSDRGIRNPPHAPVLDILMPGMLDVAAAFPIGRLLYGQPHAEMHHEMALRASERHQENRLGFVLSYVFSWLMAHLNIPTSFFWMRVLVNIRKMCWEHLKSYITSPQMGFLDFSKGIVLLVLGLFILAMTPLLILTPWLYGLAGIPFTLLRAFCMYGPINKLRHFRILKLIDVAELVKDSAIFFAYAVPFLSVLLSGVNMLLPAVLLEIGEGISFVLIPLGVLISIWLFPILFTTNIAALAGTHFFRFFGASLFLGAWTYLGLGVLGRQVYAIAPNASERAIRGFSWLLSPLGKLVDGIGKVLNYFAGETQTVAHNNIIPEAVRQANQPLPMERDALVIPAALQAEIDTLVRQMSNLNQSPHLSAERKRLFSECLSNLDTEKSGVTLQSLQGAMGTARGLLENNFTRPEADRMLALVTSLQAGADATQAPILRSERTGIMMKRGTNNYQPSWRMIQLLRDSNIPREEIATEKCDRIQRLHTLASEPARGPAPTS